VSYLRVLPRFSSAESKMSRYSFSLSAALDGGGATLEHISYSYRVFSRSMRFAYRFLSSLYERRVQMPPTIITTTPREMAYR
jgi:hypothetical protein